MNPGIALASIAALALVVLVLFVWSTFDYFRAPRRLRCPETATDAEVTVDARQAALTSVFTRPRLRVVRCSLWPERYACAEGCLSVEAGAGGPVAG
jgi:hypothetical protein